MPITRGWAVKLVIAFAVIAFPARADLLGVAWEGDVWRLDLNTGAGTKVGNAGAFRNAMALSPSGLFYSAGDGPELITINPSNGAATVVATFSLQSPSQEDIRALAFSPAGTLYAVSRYDPGNPAQGSNRLYTINPQTGATTFIGGMGTVGVQALEIAPNGTAYGYHIGTGDGPGNSGELGLVRVNLATGAITDVNPANGGVYGIQSLAFVPDGTLYGVRSFPDAGLYRIDPATDATTRIGPQPGPGEWSDIRGIAFVVPEPAALPLLAMATLGLVRRRRT